MNIQSNINQTLSIAGMLMSQTPIASTAKEKELEKMRTKQAYQRYGKALDTAEKALPESRTPTEAEYKVYEFAEGVATEAAEELFKQDPTPETAKQLKLSYEGMEEYQKAKDEEMKAQKEKEQQEKDRVKEEKQKAKEQAKEKAREEKEKRKEEKQEKMAQKARDAQKAEQTRLARSAILEGVYHPLTDMPERQAGHKTRLKEGYYTDGT